MEIYNETITDLLCNIRKKKPLGIREDVNVSRCDVNARDCYVAQHLYLHGTGGEKKLSETSSKKKKKFPYQTV